MTLEEKIVFFSHEDATDFQKYLREKDCESRINVEHDFSGEPYFEGTIADFLNLINHLIKKEEEEGEEDEDLFLMKKDIEERKAKLEEFINEHTAGDVLRDATPSQMLAQAEKLEATSDEDLKREATDKFVSSLMILATLEDNDLLEGRNDEYILKEVKSADDLRIMYAYTDFPQVSGEELKECNISSHIRTSSVTQYVITTGTDIIYADADELSDYLDNVDVDEEEAGKFIDAIFFKQAIVGKIRELIDGGCSSEKELIDALSAPAFPLEGTNDVISFDITPEYLKVVLADLRKLGLISGKDGKIKNT